MNDSRSTTGGPQNTVTGGGTINSGNFANSPVTMTTGDGNTTVVRASQPGPLMEQLRRELDEARRLLGQCSTMGTSSQHDAALDAIDDVVLVIDSPQHSHDAGKLRRRLDRVISALTPFASIIQGIASAVDVFKDIRSAI